MPPRSPISLARNLPAALAAAYVIVLLARLGETVRAIYDNSDVASGPVIGQLSTGIPHGTGIVLGYTPWYTAFWAGVLTRGLPFHRQLWEVGPWIACLAAVGLLAWSTARAAGRWAAALVVFVLACAGPGLLPVEFSWGQHALTVVNVCVLGAFLVLLVTRGGMIGRRWQHVLLTLLVSGVTAAGAASDRLLFAAGVVPFVAAGLLVALLSPARVARRLALTVVGTGALSSLGAAAFLRAMTAAHIRGASFSISFVGWSGLGTNVRYLVQSLAALFNGDFGGAAVSARSLLALCCALVVAAGGIAAIRAGRSWFSGLRASFPAEERTTAAGDAARTAHLSFWLLAAALTTITFVLSDLAAPSTGRYLLPTAFGIAAVVATTVARADRWIRGATVVGVCVLVTGSIVGLAARDLKPDAKRHEFAQFLTTLAAGDNLQFGYAPYWDAAALTWQLHQRIQLYPIVDCNAAHGYCWFPFHRIDSWYTPRAGVRTFLVTDKRYGPNPPGLRLGGPDEVVTDGPYTVYVYKYDIASDLGRP